MRRGSGHPLLTPAPALHSEFLMQVSAKLDDPQILPDAPRGTRRILHVKRGSFSGPGLEGQVLPSGGDWVLMRRDGVAELAIRFTLRTRDAQWIYMRWDGIFDMSPQVSERIFGTART